LSDAGSDWSTIFFMDVASRQKLDDVIIRTKFASLRWTTDNRGIFYATYAGALDNIDNGKKTEENAVKNFSLFF
jgi:prolyl oligopeptidase PreP (S9A serine peptidase family)